MTDRGHVRVDDSFSLKEAASVLGLDPSMLEGLLKLSEVSVQWGLRGRVGENTVRALWKKLYA